jgi:coenzyme Q-binding protein COQ10
MPRHSEQRQLPYRADQMFDLVADVRRYPEFLPWCRAARIRSSTESELVADLVIGFKGITERFTSRVALHRDDRLIVVTYEDGPFKYLTNRWEFIPTDDDTACIVDFYVDFEFRSRFLQRMIGLVFTEAVKRMVAAFETRADALYEKRMSP